jgi:hypothetical protein
MRLLLAAVLLLAPATSWAGVEEAVVRIPSHGGSGTVVATGKGWSLILSCAHMFDKIETRAKAIELDVPLPSTGAPEHAGIKLIGIDYQADLSMIQFGVGPLPHVCGIANAAFKPGANVWSVGYDDMQAITVRKATILGTAGNKTYTVEIPWHGRSGGALMDASANALIGVVHGYETINQKRGMYVSLATIHAFVNARGYTRQKQAAQPQIFEYRTPGVGALTLPGGGC